MDKLFNAGREFLESQNQGQNQNQNHNQNQGQNQYENQNQGQNQYENQNQNQNQYENRNQNQNQDQYRNQNQGQGPYPSAATRTLPKSRAELTEASYMLVQDNRTCLAETVRSSILFPPAGIEALKRLMRTGYFHRLPWRQLPRWRGLPAGR